MKKSAAVAKAFNPDEEVNKYLYSDVYTHFWKGFLHIVFLF